MEIFKEKHLPNLPEINPQGTPEQEATTNNEVGTQAEGQGAQPDLVDSESAELNALLKRLLDPNIQSEPLDKPMSLASSKRLRNKRKAKQPAAPTKSSYNPPTYVGKSNSNKDSID